MIRFTFAAAAAGMNKTRVLLALGKEMNNHTVTSVGIFSAD